MPTNPFDISVLDQVDFGAGTLGHVPGAGTTETVYPNYYYGYKYFDSSSGTIDRYSPLGVDSRHIVNPGSISIISDQYTAGYRSESGTQYYHATFGTIKFANSPQNFLIVGFGSDGKTLFLIPDGGVPGPSAGADINLGVIFRDYGVYLLSTEGLVPYVPDTSTPVPITLGNDPTAFTAAVAAVCFAEGTRIETGDGQVAIENLAEGDVVVTASGASRAIKWIGQMVCRPAYHSAPVLVNPVRVRANAFGPGLPLRDLRLSPGHAVLIEGVLVPIGHLINGATIVQEEVSKIRYFHIELESHDALIAEGLACESYLDDGNRETFANADGFAALHGRLDPQSWDDACAPMVAAGPQLTEIQQRLHAQASALGWAKTEEPALRLMADGTEISPLHAAGNRFWFAVPAAATLVLRSNAGVLSQLMPGLADDRVLGVAVSDLRVDGEPVDLDDGMFGVGFYPLERHADQVWRWTDGDAALVLGGEGAMIEVTLTMVAPSWLRAAPVLRIVNAA